LEIHHPESTQGRWAGRKPLGGLAMSNKPTSCNFFLNSTKG
jgi:hypothetical protein